MEKLWKAIERSIKDGKKRKVRIGRARIVIEKKEDLIWIYIDPNKYSTDGLSNVDTLIRLNLNRRSGLEKLIDSINNLGKMEKYIKKPVVVEAIQLKENNIREVYTEVFTEPDLNHPIASDKWDEYEEIVKQEGLKLITPESGKGTQIASIGDYIVFGYSKKLGRHCWPVKPDYFKENYEKRKI